MLQKNPVGRAHRKLHSADSCIEIHPKLQSRRISLGHNEAYRKE